MSITDGYGNPAKCECADQGCPVHKGKGECKEYASVVLYRVDMEDLTGTFFCEDCASDAMESGVFTDESPEDDPEEDN